MIEKSLNNKTRYDDFITKFSKIYTPIVIAIAILVLLFHHYFIKILILKFLYTNLLYF